MWLKTASGAIVDASGSHIDIRKDAKGEHFLEMWWPAGREVVEIAHGTLAELQETRDSIFNGLAELQGGLTIARIKDGKLCKNVPDLPSA